MSGDGTLWQVTAPHFVAGLVERGGLVVETAPILRWAQGRTRAWLSEYFRQRGWTAHRVGAA